MEYFLQLFGDKSIGWAVAIICVIVFLAGCYKKVEKYFSEKAIQERDKSDKIQKVIEQAEQYPMWHQQSIRVQEKFNGIFGDLGEKIEQINQSLESIKKENQENRATEKRYRILRFNDEILHDERHSKEHFDQILDDVTEYERYCSEHPDYKNNKAELAIENIKHIYRKCNDEGSFL